MVDVHGDRNGHVHHGPRPVPRQVGHLGDLAVGGDDHLAVSGAHRGDPQRDVLDRPDSGIVLARHQKLDEVSVAVLALADDEEAGQEILDHALGPEPQRHGRHRGRGDQGGQRDAEAFQDGQAGHAVDDHQDRPGDHRRQRVPVLGRLRADQRVGLPGVGVDPVHDLAAQPGGEPGQQDRAGHEQDDLQPAAPRPMTDVRQRRMGGDAQRHGLPSWRNRRRRVQPTPKPAARPAS